MQLVPKSSSRIAGLLSYLSVAAVMPFWVIMLFLNNPTNVGAFDQFQYAFSVENPARSICIWLVVLPLLSGMIGSAYLLNWARIRAVAIILVALTITLGLLTAINNAPLAIFVLLPSYWGWLTIKDSHGWSE